MDEDTKTSFKWKFYRLTIQLNIIILLAAVSIVVFFLFQSIYTLLVVVAILILILVLCWDFFRRYRKTKAWLDEQAEQGKNP